MLARSMLSRSVAWLLFGWLACACVACTLLCGCRVPLGTDDVELRYRYDATQAKTSAARLARAVRARLGAASIAADVDVDAANEMVRVVVESERSRAADHVLRWRGGVTLHALADGGVLDAGGAPGLEEHRDVAPDGSVDHYWSGAPGAVMRFVYAAELGPELMAVGERLDQEHARTHVVRRSPLVDLHDALADVTRSGGGRGLTLWVSRAGRARLALLPAGTPVAVVMTQRALSVGPSADPEAPLEVWCGDDLRAYQVAARIAEELATPALPELERLDERPLPMDGLLAFGSVAVPLFVSLAWLVFVRRFDRAHPEPRWLVAATFAVGAAVAPLAGLIERGAASLSPYLDPALATLGGQLVALPLAIGVATLTNGLVEESLKLFGAWSLAFHRHEFDEPIDGIIYGAAASLGFAATENFAELARGRMTLATVAARGFLTVPGHMFWGAIWGYALGQTLVKKKRRGRLPLYLLLAALGHGTYDAICRIPDLSFLVTPFDFALAWAFVVLVRRALRHGVVAKGAAHAHRRETFLVGRRLSFWLCARVLVAAVGLTRWLARGYSANLRAGYSSLVLLGLLVLAIGVLGYLVTATLPLDVAIDDHGVTFAGASRPWSDITGWQRHGRFITLGAHDGDLELGPGKAHMLARIELSLSEHRERASSSASA